MTRRITKDPSSQVWVAICSSSSEVSTRTEQRDVGSLMGFSKDRFRLGSRLIPSQERPPQIAARTSASCSPIPAGEDQQINPIERGDHGRHLFAD
jgi:hypothetical protein